MSTSADRRAPDQALVRVLARHRGVCRQARLLPGAVSGERSRGAARADCWRLLDRMHAERRTCSLAWRVDAGQGFIWGHDWCSRRGWQRYSTEVQQLTRTRADLRGRGRTVTCRYGRGWTCCRQMACKRSAVRARLAPLVRSEIRTRSNSEYSRKVQQRRPGGPPYVCSDRASSAGWGCWQDTGFQALNRRWPACHLGKSQSRRSRDSCCLITTRPSWRAIPASDCCRICK